jgi:hypothetical protein
MSFSSKLDRTRQRRRVLVSFKNPPLLVVPVFAACALLASFAYALMPLEGPIGVLLSYLLLPGVAMYANLNGSLLFGAGLGDFGNFLVIALGSAAVWAVPVVALVACVAAIARFARP